jgi:hypothetical protein
MNQDTDTSFEIRKPKSWENDMSKISQSYIPGDHIAKKWSERNAKKSKNITMISKLDETTINNVTSNISNNSNINNNNNNNNNYRNEKAMDANEHIALINFVHDCNLKSQLLLSTKRQEMKLSFEQSLPNYITDIVDTYIDATSLILKINNDFNNNTSNNNNNMILYLNDIQKKKIFENIILLKEYIDKYITKYINELMSIRIHELSILTIEREKYWNDKIYNDINKLKMIKLQDYRFRNNINENNKHKVMLQGNI